MLRVLIKLLVILLLVYAGVYAGYGQLEKKYLVIPETAQQQKAAPGNPVEKISQTLQKTTNYQIIVARNIFEAVLDKNVKPVKKAPVVVEKAAEPTTLKLILQGTVVGNDQDARAIIIDQKNKKQDIYQIGDAVAGALVTAIERGKVVLEVNGKKQFLQIKDRQGGGPGAPRASPFVMKSTRTAYSRKAATPVKPVIPHRRISFKQKVNKDEANGEIDPVEADGEEEPFVEEGSPEDDLSQQDEGADAGIPAE
jgi:type II secretory pathway component PulC